MAKKCTFWQSINSLTLFLFKLPHSSHIKSCNNHWSQTIISLSSFLLTSISFKSTNLFNVAPSAIVKENPTDFWMQKTWVASTTFKEEPPPVDKGDSETTELDSPVNNLSHETSVDWATPLTILLLINCS